MSVIDETRDVLQNHDIHADVIGLALAAERKDDAAHAALMEPYLVSWATLYALHATTETFCTIPGQPPR